MDGKVNRTIHIEYDVDRPDRAGGDMIMKDGYFIHFISPKNLPSVKKEVIFLIDRSGSMGHSTDGTTRWEQTKKTMRNILNQMRNETKTNFNIAMFSTDVKRLWPESMPTTSEYIDQAINYVDSTWASGRTFLLDAMETTFNSFNTDMPDTARILFLLSDGQPTGSTWDQIHKMHHSNIETQGKITLFCFSIGEKELYPEFNALAKRTDGVARHIYGDLDVDFVVSGFYHTVAVPVIANINCQYSNTKKLVCSDTQLFKNQGNGGLSSLK